MYWKLLIFTTVLALFCVHDLGAEVVNEASGSWLVYDGGESLGGLSSSQSPTATEPTDVVMSPPPSTGICPRCWAQGRKSEMRLNRWGTTTAMGCGGGIYFDEDGVYHPARECNITTVGWRCTNHHRGWMVFRGATVENVTVEGWDPPDPWGVAK